MSASFTRPVTILVGLGVPRRIASAGEALAYLMELPHGTRDEAFDATVSACRDALAGRLEARRTQDIVAAHARRRGVLVDELPEPARRDDAQPMAA